MALRNAAYCDSSHSQFATVDQLDQKYIFVPQHVKECYLAYILMETSYKDTSAIVFSSTRFGTRPSLPIAYINPPCCVHVSTNMLLAFSDCSRLDIRIDLQAVSSFPSC